MKTPRAGRRLPSLVMLNFVAAIVFALAIGRVRAATPSLLPGSLQLELYTNIAGGLVSDLRASPKFPDQPDLIENVSSFETLSDSGDLYGERLTGYLLPPQTGDYIFYLCSDDQGELYLSPDTNPTNKVLIASESGWSFPRSWTGIGAGRSNANNISSPIHLEGGKHYYVEGLHKEFFGGDNFGVAWQLPGGSAPANGSPPIGGEFLSRAATEIIEGPGSLDPSFDPSLGGKFIGLAQGDLQIDDLVAQRDGKIVLGGVFVGVDGIARPSLARLNPDGKLDPSFQPPAAIQAPGDVHLALQSDGKILVAQGRNVHRLNADGSLDQAFKPEPDDQGSVLLVQPDGKILIAGSAFYTEITHSNYLDRLNPDGTRDLTFQRRHLTSLVRRLALQPDGKILAGGGLSSPGWLARFNPDGTLDNSLSPVTIGEGEVDALAVGPEGKVVIGGSFQSVNGAKRAAVARLNPDGSNDPSFNPQYSSVDPHLWVFALAVQPDGTVIIGGIQAEKYGNSYSYGTGSLLLLKLKTDGTEDIAFAARVGALTGNQYASIHSLAIQPDGKILASGNLAGRGVARVFATGALDESFRPDVQGAPGKVDELLAQASGGMFVVGQFSSVAGSQRPGLARLQTNGVIDSSFIPNLPPDYRVVACAQQPHGKVLVVAGKEPYLKCELLRLYADGRRDFAFSPSIGGTNHSCQISGLLVQPDQRIVVAGNFDSVNGVSRRGLARIDADGSLDSSFDAGSGFPPADEADVKVLLLQPDGKIVVGGSFTGVNGTPRQSLARLMPDGSVDPTFEVPYLDRYAAGLPRVLSLALQPDGKILVGLRAEVWPNPVPIVVRINPDGSLDARFHVGSGATAGTDIAYINALVVQPDGKILAGGAFDTYDGQLNPNLIRLLSDGTVDTRFAVTWDPLGQISPWAIGEVRALALQVDGRILVGGCFKEIEGVPRWGIACLIGDPVANSSFVTRSILGNFIRLLARPNVDTSVYALEDQPPLGWAIANISDEGVFDAHTGKVKFGPFYDRVARDLKYESFPPPGFVGIGCVAGVASANGVNSPITGDVQIVVIPPHPADTNPTDWVLRLDEVTAYAAAWRTGGLWLLPPNPIPMSYVTRAAALWRGGETYTVNPGDAEAPMWWVNVVPVRQGTLSTSVGLVRSVMRDLPPSYVAGGSLEVGIHVCPGPDTLAYAVEESVSSNARVSNIDNGGQFDAISRQIKWGPFSDGLPRVLRYQILPMASAGDRFNLAGTASFDGALIPIGGNDETRAGSRLAWASPPQKDHWTVCLAGAENNQFELETSTNLVDWTVLGVVTNGLAGLPVPIDLPGDCQRFYRAKLLR